MKKLIATVAVLTAFPAVAFANTSCPLKFFDSDTGLIAWQSNRIDSPLDSNSERLGVHLLNQDGDDWAGAYNTCSGLEGKLVGAVTNLSFEYENETANPFVHIGAGAPRYSVDLDTDGDGQYNLSAFLSALYCNVPLSENPGWSRSDFTGRVTVGCTIYVDGIAYSSDGTKSAWKVYAEANPTHRVLTTPVGSAYLIMDEAGTAFVDRLAFGKKMYIRSGTGTASVKSCASESAC